MALGGVMKRDECYVQKMKMKNDAIVVERDTTEGCYGGGTRHNTD